MNIDLVKGGHDISAELADRIAVSQRPADGHVKSANWEDYSILTAGALNCHEGAGILKKGDFVAVHTTPTTGLIEAIGIAVEGAVEGLELELVAMNGTDSIDLSKTTTFKSTYNSDTAMYEVEDGDIADVVGGEQAFITAVYDVPSEGFVKNTDVIGFRVKAVPSEGGIEGMRIVTRMQYRQPARTPAYLECCGGRDTVINPANQ